VEAISIQLLSESSSCLSGSGGLDANDFDEVYNSANILYHSILCAFNSGYDVPYIFLVLFAGQPIHLDSNSRESVFLLVTLVYLSFW
jgi:hypothetical protein